MRIIFSALVLISISGSAFAQTTPTEFYKLGNEALKQAKHDTAISMYSQCISLDPKANGCIQNRALAFAEQSRRDPLTTDAYTKFDGKTILNPKRHKALEDINKALEIVPNDGKAYFVRAYIYQLEGIHEKAVEDYTRGLTFDPGNQIAKANLAKEQKNYASSLASAGRMSIIAAATVEQAGDKAGAAKLYQTAIVQYTKSLELDSTAHLTWISRADAYKYQKMYDAAVSDYTESLKYKPDFADALVRRGEMYFEQKKTALALADFEKVIGQPVGGNTSKYQIGNALIGRGRIRLAAGQTDAAIVDFNAVLAESPNHVMALLYRGQAHAKKKNKPLAIADLKKALEIAPKFPEASAELKKLQP